MHGNLKNSWPPAVGGSSEDADYSNQQRTARAMCMKQKRVLLDEPTSALDPEMVKVEMQWSDRRNLG